MPEPFDEDVVEITTMRGSLYPYIGCPDPYSLFRLSISTDGLLQCLNAAAGIQRIWRPASQHFARRPIHDCYKIHKAIPDGDVDNAAAPHRMKALILYAPHPKESIGFVAIDSVFEPFWNLDLLFTGRSFEPIPSESCRLSSKIMRIHPHILDFITQRGCAFFT